MNVYCDEWSEVMNFKIKNFGKITEANIKLDGITVICGNNNTGKSTVGKALFSFFNSLYDYKDKVVMEKQSKLEQFVNRNNGSISDFFAVNEQKEFIALHEGEFTAEEVLVFLEKNTSVRVSEEKISTLLKYLNTSNTDIINQIVFNYFDSVMNGQIRNANKANRIQCVVSGEFGDGQCDNIVFNKQKCSCEIGEEIEHNAYYINSPFALDWLNQGIRRFYEMNLLEKNVIEAIVSTQNDFIRGIATDVIDSILNKNDLEEVRKVLKQAYSGDTKIINGKYFYHENNVDFDFRNISAGLKSFALIERMLETGALKRKDVLILDEPEIHLHSEWQIIYAELIVILQKKFELTILLVTHSFQFLESLNFFMEKYGIAEKGNYYIPTQTEKGITIVDSTDNLAKIRKSLKSGMYTLADMKLAELDNGDHDEDDNE